MDRARYRRLTRRNVIPFSKRYANVSSTMQEVSLERTKILAVTSLEVASGATRSWPSANIFFRGFVKPGPASYKFLIELLRFVRAPGKYLLAGNYREIIIRPPVGRVSSGVVGGAKITGHRR